MPRRFPNLLPAALIFGPLVTLAFPTVHAQTLDARISLEINETDGEAKVIISADSNDALRRLEVTAPDGTIVADHDSHGRLPGLSRLVIDTDDASIEAVKSAYPEGTYALRAVCLDGTVLLAEADLSHQVLPAPTFSPSGGEEVRAHTVVIRWEPVAGAAGYQVGLEHRDLNVNWQVGPETLAIRVPAGLLTPGVVVQVDMTTLTAEGNAGVAESSFVTSSETPGGLGDPSFPGDRQFVSEGSGSFFILEVGYQLVLEGQERSNPVRLESTVLAETEVIDGVETRVVEERKWRDGALVETTRRFLALGSTDGSLYSFGATVDRYEDGELIRRQRRGFRAGPAILLPGRLRDVKRVNPENQFVPGVVGLLPSLRVEAGRFRNVLLLVDPASSLGDGSQKYYGAGVGLIKTESLELVDYGFILDDDDDDDDADDDDDD